MINMDYLTENDKALLASKGKRIAFSKNETIISEASSDNGIFIIRSGHARVQRLQSDVRLATLVPGDVCGEMGFLEGTQASAAVIADEPVIAHSISSTELQDIFNSFPHLAARFYRSTAVILSRRLRDTSRQASRSQSHAIPRPFTALQFASRPV